MIAFADIPAVFGFAFFLALGLLVGFLIGLAVAVCDQTEEGSQ